jgi:hypothetical protein
MIATAFALAAALLAASPRYDTVFLANGGRLRGTIVEDTPAQVLIQLPDGSFRRFARAEVARIEYAEEPAAAAPPPAAAPVATPVPVPPPAAAAPPAPVPVAPPVPVPVAPAVPAPAAPPAPPPSMAIPPPPPPPSFAPAPRPRTSAATRAPEPPFAPDEVVWPRRLRPPPPPPEPRHPPESTGFQVSVAIEGLGPVGRLSRRGPYLDNVVEGEAALALEIGGKPTPDLFLGLLLEGAGGPHGATFAGTCRGAAADCVATTGRAGVLARFYFSPGGSHTGWLAIGTGVESTSVSAFQRNSTVKLAELTATGWEIARASLGLDFRLSPVVGVGVYAVASVARFDTFSGSLASDAVGGKSAHGWVGAGVRTVLFP